MAGYCGFYINLERSLDRRAAMQAQLAKLGLAPLYTRFSAVDGANLRQLGQCAISAGELGAFLSHTGVLAQAAARQQPVHVLEDDALLSASTGTVLSDIVSAGLLNQFDLIFTDTFVAPDLGMIKAINAAFERAETHGLPGIRLDALELTDISRMNFACLTSYMLAPRGLQRVLPLLRAEIDRGPKLPIDLFLRQCANAGIIRAGLLTPFVTGFRLEDVARSTIGAAAATTEKSVMVLAVLRYLFFIERDIAFARGCLARALAGLRPAPNAELVLQALGFVLSGDFRQF